MCDGHGYAHPRRFGLACYIGVELGTATLGVGKSLLCGQHRTPGLARGCRTQLTHKGEVIGAAVRTRCGVKPVYVSAGHLITLKDAMAWTLRAATSARLCQPIRLAHQYVTHLGSV